MTSRPDIKLVLSDIDGTLVTRDKVLTDAARNAVRDLRAAGIAFAITSSRPPRGLQMLIGPLALETPISGCNGGHIVNPDLSLIAAHPLDLGAAKRIVELMGARGLAAWVYTEDAWIIPSQDGPHVAREAWILKFSPTVKAVLTDADLSTAVQIVGVSDDPALVAACEKEMQAALGDVASAERSQPYFLDVTHPLGNKGQVVATLAERLSIRTDQIATIGDMPNDVLMFRRSGLSIAMGNAGADVKAQATCVTDSCEDEGFARAMHRFVLHSATA